MAVGMEQTRFGLQQEEFDTYESEIEQLEVLSGLHIPSMLGGAKVFLGTVNKWVSQGDDLNLEQNVVVLPDPTANLSFPYPSDELSLALAASSGISTTDEELHALARRFNISIELLERPTTTLSGGERMLVSLAKAFALAKSAKQLCICSPYFWLDPDNRKLVREQFGSIESGGDVHLLLLRGEDDACESHFTYSPQKELNWHLHINQPSVLFPAQSFPRVTQEKQITFVSNNSSMKLRSPTLLTGRNGVGKTTFARLLAQLIQPETGKVEIITRGLGGGARLLLQDTVVHLFGDPVAKHLSRVFCFDKELGKQALRTYTSLQRTCLHKISNELPDVRVADGDRQETMLQCKLAVVVDRLTGAPPLLILDEPGWCLSKTVGSAFVESVVGMAHARGIAVMIVSHQTGWWNGLVADELQFVQDQDDVQTVRLNLKSARGVESQ